MKMQLASLALAAALAPCAVSAGVYEAATPMFKVLPAHGARLPVHTPGSQLTQWNGSFTDLKGNHVSFTMVGTDPTSTNTSTTTTVLIIPIKMVYGSSNGNMTFNPKKHKPSNANGLSVVQNLLASPLFQSEIDFNQNGTDLGTTQYEDAFQRGNFWGNNVKNESGYHVLFTTKMEKMQTINVSASQGRVENNPIQGNTGQVGTMDINAFDSQLQAIMAKLTDVNPGVLPLFVTYDIYLTEGGLCCVGGYHSENGGSGSQTYAYATYEDNVGDFSQDVSAFSHELGEWLDDPYGSNHVDCAADKNYLEVGDPLEGFPNYGGVKYTVNGFTYNLQDLVDIDYFGAPTSWTANGWYSLNDLMKNVCPSQ